MKHFLSFSFILLLLWGLGGCSRALPVESGVSLDLAQQRAALVSGLRYDLSFSIPASLEEPCAGEVTLRFDLSRKGELQLDFRPGAEAVQRLAVNGREVSPDVRNEHIVIPGKALRKGANEISISFTPDDAPLNRRPEFLYTLLVPDRARSREIPAQVRLSAFRSLAHRHSDSTVTEELWKIWEDQRPWPGLELSSEDYNTLACELALRRPGDREALRARQRSPGCLKACAS